MSMNCPKCGFYQPEDQYCASCGVDMEKYQPKETPLWRRVLGNWIFQLGVLIFIVIVLIVSDNMSSEKRVIVDRGVPLSAPVKSSKSRSADGKVLPPPVEKGAPPVAPPPMPGAAQKAAAPEGLRANKPAVATATEGELAKAASAIADTSGKSKAAPMKKLTSRESAAPMERTVASYFYLVPRGIFENLISTSGTPVEDGVTLLKSRDFGRELKTRRSEWKKLGSQRQSFEFEKSKLIFVGTTAGETTSKIGYYVRTQVLEPEDDRKINVELRTWSELKPGEESVGGPASAIELGRREIILVSNIVPRDLSFSETERSFFEGHPALRALNHPQFIEENLELVLVLQYK